MCERSAPGGASLSRSFCPSWRLRRQLFSQPDMCGVRLRTAPTCSATESAWPLGFKSLRPAAASRTPVRSTGWLAVCRGRRITLRWS
jgi:hypothetical protein